MIINLNKKDLVLETKDLVTNVKICTKDGNCKNISSLNFEGFAGFNNKYVEPLFEVLGNKTTVGCYKHMFIVGNLHNDAATYEADLFILKNVRATAFLYKVLKSFAISLPDLRLGYGKNDKQETLYLDKKIIRCLSSLNEESSRELTLYFYCLVRLLKSIDLVNPKIVLDNSGNVEISEDALSDIMALYGTLPETLTLECISLKEDVTFQEVTYIHNNLSSYVKDFDVKSSSTFVYNILKSKFSENLCLINLSTKEKEYYLINDKGYIYTNNELKEYNMFDFIEWIPTLVVNLLQTYPTISECKVKHLDTDKLLYSKDVEILVSNDASKFENFLEKYPQITENTNKDVYKGYFKGSTLKFDGGISTLEDMYAHDKYAQELYKQVQPYYKDFDLKDLTGIVKGVSKGEIYSMLFEGESGTGKSTAARVIASRCGIPFVAINCSTNIEESDIFGTMIPNPEKSSTEDAEFIWKDGPLTKAVRYGYVGIIEELGFARPGILGKLNSLLDESRQIDLPNGEVLKAHPNFRIIGTTNIGYEGTNRLNKAFINRFEVCKKFTDLSDKELKSIIISRTNYDNQEKINKILDIYRAIKKYSDEQNLGLVISIRQLLTIFKQGKYYKSAKDAVGNLLLNQAFLEEPEHLKHFTDTVLSAFDTSFKL